MQISCVRNYEHQEANFFKISKNHVQHKIEGFCDQNIVNKVLQHILILLEKTIKKLLLDTSLTTPFLTFECPKMVNRTCLVLKKIQKPCSA